MTETKIANIQGADITLILWETGHEEVQFKADLDVDCDGSGGNPHHDPYFQPDTTLHYKGQPLNAEKIPFIVVPPIICQKTKGKVLGSRCVVTNTKNKKSTKAVVGDIGPSKKVGEGSPALCELLGINSNPNTGGEDQFVILYEIYIDQPAKLEIDGELYEFELKSYGYSKSIL